LHNCAVAFFLGGSGGASTLTCLTSSRADTKGTRADKARDARTRDADTKGTRAIRNAGTYTDKPGDRAEGRADFVGEVFLVAHTGPNGAGRVLDALTRCEFLLLVEQRSGTECCGLTDADKARAETPD
jgi:hypothetical protein